ncbi:MAG TPA: helix-turn-helix transcriptional regulator [Candidatus Paceibacterota bacterium]|nr:helix-turn-helix transcriptional regulator [Candidatus Pacearchaeota archaeon]HRZ51342.1 helix-turn-helix transcriptional regulator [Candidatus Paceibacterota bacterium]HSA37064.1 helix-turn-helix transcriptional regulator [Candidatus Paceibacterota bacterium]
MKNLIKKNKDPIKAIKKYPLYGHLEQEIEARMKIAIEINCARLAIGMTQEKLAEKAKTTQKIISKVENGDYKIGVDLLTRLAKSLGIKLLFGDAVISRQSGYQSVVTILRERDFKSSGSGQQETSVLN